MILEILFDIKSFLIILIVTMIAYTQIKLSLNRDSIEEKGKGMWRDVYVLSFGELGDYEDLSSLEFSLFVIFSLFIPLVLMNLLIAIMSDSYARI